MSLVTLLVAIILVGLILYLVRTLIPMDPKISQVLSVVVAVLLILWILGAFLGFGPGIHLK